MRVSRFLWALIAAGSLWAGEYAVLATGFRLRAERHSFDGDRTILYDRDGGYSVIPSVLVAGFEADDYVPPAEPSAPAALSSLNTLVREASARHRLDPALVHSVIAAESAYNPGAISPKGAQGLMQLMPATARELLVSNAMDPAQNVNAGAAYLRRMLDRYAGFKNQVQRALAAYNAGPAKVDLYNGLPPYRETVNFVSRVMTRWGQPARQP